MSTFNIEMLPMTPQAMRNDRLSSMQDKNKLMPETDSKDSGKTTFAELLTNTMEDTKKLHMEANQKVQELVAGKNKDIQGTMMALEKADISLRMLMQMRNKMVEAYKEVMHMQI